MAEEVGLDAWWAGWLVKLGFWSDEDSSAWRLERLTTLMEYVLHRMMLIDKECFS